MHPTLPSSDMTNESERGYPEVCTYTIESDDDYEDYQQGRNLHKENRTFKIKKLKCLFILYQVFIYILHKLK